MKVVALSLIIFIGINLLPSASNVPPVIDKGVSIPKPPYFINRINRNLHSHESAQTRVRRGGQLHPPIVPDIPPPPTFTPVTNNTVKISIGETVIVGEGVQVTFDCIQLINTKINSGVQNPTINWYKDGVQLTHGSAANVNISEDHRLCTINKTLLAMNGQVGTDGNYTCEVCDGTTFCMHQISTHVVCGIPHLQSPPGSPLIFSSFISLTCGDNITVHSLSNVTALVFVCSEYNGSEPLTWKIYKDGELILYNSFPTINNPTDSDYGTYAFVLSSAHCGSVMAVSRVLHPGDPPEIDEGSFVPRPSNVQEGDKRVKIGTTAYVHDRFAVIIECYIVNGTPPITIQWFHNGLPDLTRGNDPNITITNALNGDVFKCRADNNVGFDIESTTVYVECDWPYPTATVVGVCITSMTLSLTMNTNQSTCRFYSYRLYLMSSGRKISPTSYNTSHFHFNRLTTNTMYSVEVTFRHGVDVNTVSVRYANTLYLRSPNSVDASSIEVSMANDDIKVAWEAPEVDDCSMARNSYYEISANFSTGKFVSVETSNTSVIIMPEYVEKSGIDFEITIVVYNSEGRGSYSTSRSFSIVVIAPVIDKGSFVSRPSVITRGNKRVKIGTPVYVHIGFDVIIDCNIVNGTPPINITWFRNGSPYTTRESVSTITITDASNGDIFKCRADNIIAFDTENTTIHVEYDSGDEDTGSSSSNVAIVATTSSIGILMIIVAAMVIIILLYYWHRHRSSHAATHNKITEETSCVVNENLSDHGSQHNLVHVSSDTYQPVYSKYTNESSGGNTAKVTVVDKTVKYVANKLT